MRAFISVKNKDGLLAFARELVALGVEIVSAGGTASVLRKAEVPVKELAELSDLKPVLGHRVSTLVPQLHGGLLATPEMADELAALGWPWIDIVVNDPYPLKEAIAKPGATRESVIEETDIGGPTMLMSACKGRRMPIVEFADRQRLIDWLKAGQLNKEEFVTELIAKTYAFVADYYLAAGRFHSGGKIDGMIGRHVMDCRYGENPWQASGGLFELWGNNDPLSLPKFDLVGGEGPSHVGFTDGDRLLQTITHIAAGFELNFGTVPFIAIAVKHGNACGAAVSANQIIALQLMIEGDLVSIHGASVMTNFAIGEAEARTLRRYKIKEGDDRRMFDGVVAPFFSDEAIDELARKATQKCRMFRCPALADLRQDSLDTAPRFRPVRGGFLRQENYTFILDLKHPKLEVNEEKAHFESDHQIATRRDMTLAWGIGSTSNSNTITIVSDGQVLGNAVSEQSRVDGARLCLDKVQRHEHTADGAVVYSDSFFPFPDGPQVLAEAKVSAVFASRRTKKTEGDDEVRKIFSKAGAIFCSLPDGDCRGFYAH